MATLEYWQQQVEKADKKLDEAKAAVTAFEERYKPRLTDLEDKLWSNEGTPAQQQRWERAQLEKRQERLEQDVRDRLEHVEELQKALTTTTQPGNDFVTRALGT